MLVYVREGDRWILGRFETVSRLGPFPRLTHQPEQLHEAVHADLALQGQAAMSIHPCYIGCDVSKRTLDLYDPALKAHSRIANHPEEIAHFARTLQGRPALVVLEATGAYDRALRAGLAQAGVAFVRVNPTRAHHFAKAANRQAKTDPLDARMLSLMGERMRLEPDLPEDPACKALKDLQVRRDQLVQIRADEKKRLHDVQDPIGSSVSQHIAYLDGAIADLDTQIKTLIASTDALQQTQELLRSVPGIGPVTAQVLMAQMPELGRLSPKKIAALAGLAPINQDSGAMRGVRRITGGRKRVRQALYMASLAAIRSNLRLSQFYKQVKQRSKATKIAIIATARKLLTILNAIIRDNVRYSTSSG